MEPSRGVRRTRSTTESDSNFSFTRRQAQLKRNQTTWSKTSDDSPQRRVPTPRSVSKNRIDPPELRAWKPLRTRSGDSFLSSSRTKLLFPRVPTARTPATETFSDIEAALLIHNSIESDHNHRGSWKRVYNILCCTMMVAACVYYLYLSNKLFRLSMPTGDKDNHPDRSVSFPDSMTAFYNRVNFKHETFDGSNPNLTSLFQEMNNLNPNKPLMIANYHARQASTADNSDVVLATHSSSSRTKLVNLATQLEHWDGPASVALHVDNMDAIEALEDFIKSSPPFLSKTSIHVMMELSRDDGYPHNPLRNLALANLGGGSHFFVALDVDFVPAKNAHAGLKALLQSDSILRRELIVDKRVFVLPAFEVNAPPGEKLATQDMLPASKTQLQEMVVQGKAEGFHQSRYAPGHGPTDFYKWFQDSTRESSYNIEYQENFEPYVLGYRSPDIPKYWPHYRGFGCNMVL